MPVTQGALVAGRWYLKGAFVAPGFLSAPFRYLPTGSWVIKKGARLPWVGWVVPGWLVVHQWRGAGS